MKKVIALLLALVMVFALCACGSSSSAPASSDSSAKKEALTFTTGGEAGTYYAFGSVLAQYVSNNSGKHRSMRVTLHRLMAMRC